MTHRGKAVFARFLGVLAVLALVSAPLAAQQTTGKIEGTVTDQAGVPIANAQVLIVGTSFGATTNDKGYYFFNNVPVGTYTVRAQFIGYAPAEVRGVRVLGGQTLTADVKMESSAVQVTGVTITAAANPIVPRDQVASKSIVSGDLINALPAEDIRQIIAVQPGVVESGSGMGLSIRGGRPGEANIYIDGAPVRAGQGNAAGGSTANPRIDVGTNAIEEASVTTGALGVEFADAQSGVISLTTRAGGSSYSGALSYSSDEPFGDAISVGQNRFEASFGGPVPSVKNLTFFVSGTAAGQQSDFRGWGAEDVPRYVTGGLDTTVTRTVGGITQSFAIPTFVQYSGACPSGSDAANAARNAILNNYGAECQGRRFPMNWTTDMRFQGKLQYSYGDGSRVFLSGVGNGQQGRNAPGRAILAPSLFTGFHNWSRMGALDVNHVFLKSAERALSLNLNVSYQVDGQIAGPLDPDYEASTRSPFMGMEWGTVEFTGLAGIPFPLTQQIIDNMRTNSGLRVPLLDRDDLRNTQESRVNPYGMETSWVESGFDQAATLYQEKRYTGRATADWQMNRFNRFQFGGDFTKTKLAYWQSNLLRQSFMDAYVVDPIKYGLYASDRLDLGDVVLELGLRYDYYDANAMFANVPGRIYTNPAFNRPASIANPDSLAASLARVMTPSQGHSNLSPRVRVAFPVTEYTNFRLSYAHQVQSPDFNTLLVGINNDLDFTNTNDIFGRDLQFAKTILFEFGVRHAFSQDMVLDISAYNKDKVSDMAARIVPYDDPFNPGDIVNLNVLTNSDFGNIRGVDMKLDRRVGNYVNASVGYTFQLARGTGSDPFSYLRTFSRQISAVTGDRVPPPQAILPTDDNREHNIVGSIAVSLPDDWRRGTTLGTVLRNTSIFATFRAASGLPYTRLDPTGGTGTLAVRTAFGLVSNATETLNSSALPWTRNVDLRFTKGVKLGGQDLTVFADFRNLLNFKNVVNLFAETGDVVNATHRDQALDVEFQLIETEARNNGRLLANGDINLVPSCASWTVTGGSNGPVVNCVALRRVEARFGNGDGLYTRAERETAFNAYYDAFNGPFTLYGEPRHIRIGFELNLR
jgi:outer membrane receptor for ferrienterochelin and colicin